MKFLVITGMSGAGKSMALDFFEDKGYFCVDNLPPTLISKFAELINHSQLEKIAVVCDVRSRKFFNALVSKISYLQEKEIDYEILYLEADNKTLIKRYKETRRRHPLGGEGRILDAIKKERSLLQELRGQANQIIDTSYIDIKSFYEQLNELYMSHKLKKKDLSISVISFGFKYGIPMDADLVLDVRFLPNPYYIKELKEHTGEEKIVQDFIMKWPITKKFFDKFFDLVDFLLPEYTKEGKSHLAIAIGCTGGRHRAVFTSLKLNNFLQEKNYKVNLKHRDIDK